jgi:hypothetical protein
MSIRTRIPAKRQPSKVMRKIPPKLPRPEFNTWGRLARKNETISPRFWKVEGAQAKIVVYYPRNDLSDFLARKDLTDFFT